MSYCDLVIKVVPELFWYSMGYSCHLLLYRVEQDKENAVVIISSIVDL